MKCKFSAKILPVKAEQILVASEFFDSDKIKSILKSVTAVK